jgi:hypothetical protein
MLSLLPNKQLRTVLPASGCDECSTLFRWSIPPWSFDPLAAVHNPHPKWLLSRQSRPLRTSLNKLPATREYFDEQ